MFSQEEVEAEKVAQAEAEKRREEKQFFKIGESRVVVIDKIVGTPKVSQAGKDYTLQTYYFCDTTDFRQFALEDKNFAFTRAFGPVKREHGTGLEFGQSLFQVMARQEGEREYKGRMYPVIAYDVAYVGEAPKGSIPAVGEDVAVDEIPFN